MTLVYLVAGEASGDALGARLMAALRARRDGLEFAGLGGTLMRAEGLHSLFPIDDLAVMGLLEVLPKLRHLARRLEQTRADIAACRPAVVVTIDSPGFGLRLLRAIAKLGIARAQYVAPQVWAWREGRVKHYPGLWDDLLCLLPFEPAFFASHNLHASYVGHPVLETGAEAGDGAAFRARHGIAPDRPILLVLPGSRRGEVARLAPVFGAALARLPAAADILPVVIAAPMVADMVRGLAANWPAPPLVIADPAEKPDAYAAASWALTKSGTASLELALAGVPMVVTYRVNPLTAKIATYLVRVRYAALVNLLAGEAIVPELIQQACHPARIAAELGALITDPAVGAAQRAAFARLLPSLRPAEGTPSAAAATRVLALLDRRL